MPSRKWRPFCLGLNVLSAIVLPFSVDVVLTPSIEGASEEYFSSISAIIVLTYSLPRLHCSLMMEMGGGVGVGVVGVWRVGVCGGGGGGCVACLLKAGIKGRNK